MVCTYHVTVQANAIVYTQNDCLANTDITAVKIKSVKEV